MNLFGDLQTLTLRELKKIYYNLAMLCHPDNGGQKEEMQELHTQYLHACQQIEHQKDSDYKMNIVLDRLENGDLLNPSFPSLRDIFDDAHTDFHQHFEKKVKGILDSQRPPPIIHNDTEMPYVKQGYASIIIPSEYANKTREKKDVNKALMSQSAPDPLVYDTNIKHDVTDVPDRLPETNTINMKKMTNEIIVSEHSASSYYPLDVHKNHIVNDFSQLDTPIRMYDYAKAHQVKHISQKKE